MLDDYARTALAGTRFGDVRWHPELDSTNRVAADLARLGDPEGVVVVADHQTAGRGRLGRRWQAPPGSSLLVSVLLRPASSACPAHLTTIAVALAASDACSSVAGVEPLLKWPNDLVVDDRKLGGVLAETVSSAGDQAAIVGLGVNVNWPEAPPAPTTTLAALAGRTIDRASLLVAFLLCLEVRYGGLAGAGDVDSLLADYRARSATLGRAVRVERYASVVEGQAVDVTPEGHLVVDEGGRRHVLAAGDVIHVRPAPD